MSLPRIVEVKEEATGLRQRLCVSQEHIIIYVLEHDKAAWPRLAEGVPEFEPDPPPPPRQWSADELRVHEAKTKALHRNFAQYLAGCAPEGWILRPVWNEWHSSDGLYHADCQSASNSFQVTASKTFHLVSLILAASGAV